MIKTLNPRAGAFLALLMAPELLLEPNFAEVISFLDRFPNVKALQKLSDASGVRFHYDGRTRIVEHGVWIVQDQASGALSFYKDGAHFKQLFIEQDELAVARFEKLLRSLEQSQAVKVEGLACPPSRRIQEDEDPVLKVLEPYPSKPAEERVSRLGSVHSRPVALIIGSGSAGAAVARYLEKTQGGQYEVIGVTVEEAADLLKDPQVILAGYREHERGIEISMDFALVPAESEGGNLERSQHYNPATGETLTTYRESASPDNIKN